MDDHTVARCECHRCIFENKLGEDFDGMFVSLSHMKMITCPTCGNKRCPHASDHRLACTESNEPGQPGSVYGPAEAMTWDQREGE